MSLLLSETKHVPYTVSGPWNYTYWFTIVNRLWCEFGLAVVTQVVLMICPKVFMSVVSIVFKWALDFPDINKSFWLVGSGSTALLDLPEVKKLKDNKPTNHHVHNNQDSTGNQRFVVGIPRNRQIYIISHTLSFQTMVRRLRNSALDLSKNGLFRHKNTKPTVVRLATAAILDAF